MLIFMHITQTVAIGSDVATIPHTVLKKAIAHLLMDVGVARFARDWEEIKKAE